MHTFQLKPISTNDLRCSFKQLSTKSQYLSPVHTSRIPPQKIPQPLSSIANNSLLNSCCTLSFNLTTSDRTVLSGSEILWKSISTDEAHFYSNSISALANPIFFFPLKQKEIDKRSEAKPLATALAAIFISSLRTIINSCTVQEVFYLWIFTW